MRVNPDMLTLAREAAGLTQSDLASRVDVAQSVISKYESGVRELTEPHLSAIARALSVPADFFALPDKRFRFGSSCTYHRRQQTLAATHLTQLLAELNVLRIHVALLASGLDIETTLTIPRLDIEDYNGDAAQIAKLTRDTLGVPPGPVPNLIGLIESAGGVVVLRSFGTRKLDAISQWLPTLPPVFMVNADAPVDRQRFTLAHELGHLVMHRTPTNDMEAEADRFAAEFLMPAKDIAPELENLKAERLHSMKMRWRTSMAALVRRAFDLDQITPRHYRSLNMLLSKSGYRVREPDVLDAELPAFFPQIVNTYMEQMGYTSDDMCRLLRTLPEQLYLYYGIGRPTLRIA